MGADIHGWVEVADRTNGRWDGIIRIRYLVERSYRVFAILFGIRNGYGFAPLEARRGLPDDRSIDTKLDLEEGGIGGVGITWALWSELKTVDWAQLLPYPSIQQHADSQQEALPRAAYIPPLWEALFRVMEALAVPYSDDGVPLVVWFDQE